jgi:hypothetical protein
VFICVHLWFEIKALRIECFATQRTIYGIRAGGRVFDAFSPGRRAFGGRNF